jgi:hypothetical protein
LKVEIIVLRTKKLVMEPKKMRQVRAWFSVARSLGGLSAN